MAFALRCPTCRKAFKWQPSDPDPTECPLCGAAQAELPPDNVISMPAFLKAGTRANDALYREFERSSEDRQEKAAELAGVDKSDMADLKITNMNSTLHEGAIAAAPVQNSVTQHMDMMNARGGKFGWTDQGGAEYAAGVASGAVTVNGQVTQGIAPRAGANTLAKIQGQFPR